EFFTFTIGRTF
ncbi:outer membrane assembly complex, YaeT protein, partial [Vibrio harveyi]